MKISIETIILIIIVIGIILLTYKIKINKEDYTPSSTTSQQNQGIVGATLPSISTPNYVAFVSGTSGPMQVKANPNLKYDSSNNYLSTNVSGAYNILGGVKGNLHYQDASGSTNFLSNGTDGQVLIYDAPNNIPKWLSQSSLNVGNASGVSIISYIPPTDCLLSSTPTTVAGTLPNTQIVSYPIVTYENNGKTCVQVAVLMSNLWQWYLNNINNTVYYVQFLNKPSIQTSSGSVINTTSQVSASFKRSALGIDLSSNNIKIDIQLTTAYKADGISPLYNSGVRIRDTNAGNIYDIPINASNASTWSSNSNTTLTVYSKTIVDTISNVLPNSANNYVIEVYSNSGNTNYIYTTNSFKITSQ